MGTGVSLRPNQLASLRGEEGWGWIRGAGCVGGQGGAGWGQICYGEDCRWTFVDCLI